MKNSKKFILISILTLMIFPLFLMQNPTIAQEWTYDGANTEKIPEFSVYPSECYLWNYSANVKWINGEIPPEIYSMVNIIKGDITDTFGGGSPGMNGISVYGDVWFVNEISGEKTYAYGTYPEFQLNWYNSSFAYATHVPAMIPVDNNGTVSDSILDQVTYMIEILFLSYGYPFEHSATYYNKHSFQYWNSSYNHGYFMTNLTDDGIFTRLEHTCFSFPWPNITLMSQPAQLPPDFDVKTEDGILKVSSTEFKLNLTISDADNNNDGEIDTDYLYRIQNGTEWSDWANIPNLLYWDLGKVKEGNYNITVEVKNMYGVSQEEITIEYTLEKKGPNFLPLIITIVIVSIVSVSAAIVIILLKRIRSLKEVTNEISESEISSKKP